MNEDKTKRKSTGETDDKGKDIFVGDIVKQVYKVRYRSEKTYIDVVKDSKPFRRDGTSCEVVGNIVYDPELVPKEEKDK
jgi:YopX protein